MSTRFSYHIEDVTLYVFLGGSIHRISVDSPSVQPPATLAEFDRESEIIGKTNNNLCCAYMKMHLAAQTNSCLLANTNNNILYLDS